MINSNIYTNGSWVSSSSLSHLLTTISPYITNLSLSDSLRIDNIETIEILGEDYTGYFEKSSDVLILISTLNVLKKPFWKQIKKNGISLPDDMEKFIEERLNIICREDKIKEVLKK